MAGGEDDPDPVTLASEDSFPASDPPGWIPVAAGSTAGEQFVTKGVFIRIAAQRGRDVEAQHLLLRAIEIANQEHETTSWFALRLNRRQFGIFAAFPDEAARDLDLNGEVAGRLLRAVGDCLARPPSIELCDVLVAKLP
ncbi:MAG: hypothetical protein JWQ89_4260 [Devosia sp.]|uniref:antibiotic biosynthesis monooxygenase n=1 Tax=Devosia sp. TaxID=1871048 RepID=UPI002610B8B4|nr:antibiotic biosynthesis monooxygenase [Devosia sp.]MDB5542533.1 hypothetical protein [Devosia sp.]